MKLYCSIITFALCSIHFFSFGQRSAYYDALYLKAQYDRFKSLRAEPANKELFNYYFGRLSDDALEDSIAKNPFLKGYYNSQQAQAIFSGAIQKGVSSLGSLNVTNIADGIAQFLIKRGKEELNVAFFDRMKKFLDDPKHPECKTLFPVTIEFLSSIETYRYAELIQSLREAFNKDLSNLITNVNQLIDHPKYKAVLKDFPEIRAAVRTSKIVSELSQSEEGILPDSLIHELATLPEWNEINSNLSNSFKLLDILSQSIRYVPVEKAFDTINSITSVRDTILYSRKLDTTIAGRPIRDTTMHYNVISERTIKHSEIKAADVKDIVKQRWIKLSDLNKAFKDSITLRIFIGLLYEKIKSEAIQFTVATDTLKVDKWLASNVNTIFVISGLIENFAIQVNEVDRAIKDFKDKRNNGTLNNDDYYTYISKAINLTEYGFKVANVIKEKVINDEYIIMALNANELYKNIYTKNYNNAVMNVYVILNQVFNKLPDNDSTNIPGTRRDSLKNIGPKSTTIEKILKYGNFMASVVKAESGEEVAKALEAATLPAGSYSVKQKSAFNISVNGYIGYGFDFNGGLYARGVYAPVGLSINAGARQKWVPTLSAFVGLIDVGSIATYRLENGTTEKLKQEVRLESIFSPSAQLIVEPIRGFPLAIAAGYKRTPKLFYSDKTSFIAVPATNVFNISALIDIPLFTIVNKPFDKKNKSRKP